MNPAPSRPADAVLVPTGFAGRGRVVEQHRAVNSLLGPLCGCAGFWWSRQDSGQSYGIPRTSKANYFTDLADSSLFFGVGHPLAGQARFEWFHVVRLDGRLGPGPQADAFNQLPELPKVGYRVADPARGDPALVAALADRMGDVREERRRFLQIALNTPDLYEQLKAKAGGVSDAVMEAMFSWVDQHEF